VSKKRPRVERREKERNVQKDIRDRKRLARSLPGGMPEHPIAVDTPAVIEIRAGATPCPLCGGELEVLSHDAVTRNGVDLRVARCKCRLCHEPRDIWFKLAPTGPN
jgi:hypothetical protein